MENENKGMKIGYRIVEPQQTITEAEISDTELKTPLEENNKSKSKKPGKKKGGGKI